MSFSWKHQKKTSKRSRSLSIVLDISSAVPRCDKFVSPIQVRLFSWSFFGQGGASLTVNVRNSVIANDRWLLMIAKMPEVRSESGENNDGLLSPPSVTKSKKRVTIVEEDKDITSGDNVDHQDANAPDNDENDPNNNNNKNEDDHNQTNSKHLIPMEGDKSEILSALASKVKIDLKRNQIKDSTGTAKLTEPLEKRLPSPVYKVWNLFHLNFIF